MLVEWNARLKRTAGFCYNRRTVTSPGTKIRTSRIELSTKVYCVLFSHETVLFMLQLEEGVLVHTDVVKQLLIMLCDVLILLGLALSKEY